MRSRLDREISRRLLQEVPTEPTVKNSRIDQLLCRVRAEDVQDDGKVVRAFSYRTAVAAVGAAIMLTMGTYALWINIMNIYNQCLKRNRSS